MRTKKWARPELEVCPYFTNNACQYKGKWSSLFKKDAPIHLELGCGKGDFISKIAKDHSEINYIAIDISYDVLGCARRNIEREFQEANMTVDNIALVAHNIDKIDEMMDENDIVDRIYISFCNPWPKAKHKKRRLTFPNKLEKYKVFLKENGEIYFKTDDDNLFNESIEYFQNSGFDIVYKTYDLHSENIKENVLTEHEKMFMKQGINIKFLIAKLNNKVAQKIEN